MEDPLAAALDRLWQANRGALLTRVGTVLAALEAGPALTEDDATEAARAAHVLAGALGTYGRPGSELFAEVEQALGTGPDGAAAYGALAERVRKAGAALT